MRRPSPLLRLALLAALAAGCAAAPARPAGAAAGPAWPEPPLAPRARWIAAFPAPGAEAEQPSWWRRAWSAVLGVEERRAPTTVLARPFGVAPAGDGRVLVADPEGARVLLVDWRRGRAEPVACAAAPWRAPSAVAVAADGTRFVADSTAAVVMRIPPRGPCAAVGEGRLSRPTGLALSTGRVYVVDPPRHEVVAFGADGAEAVRFGGLGDAPGRLNYPTAIAAAPDGSLLVVDALNFRVARFGPDGAWLGSFGAPGDALGAFLRPKGIAAAADGRVYVSDAETDAVTVFTAEGKPLFALGSPGSGPGELQMPAGLAVDGDRLYVADSLNGRVQVYELLGDPS